MKGAVNKKWFMVGTAAVATLITTAVVAGATYAHRGFQGDGERGPRFDSEKREVVDKAMENNDYSAWQEAVGEDSKIAQEITEDEFPRLQEAHNLRQEGKQKFEESRKIMEELGVEKGPGHGQGRR